MAIKNLVNIYKKYIYSSNIIMLFYRDIMSSEDFNISNPNIIIKRVNANNVSDCLVFQDEKYEGYFRKFLLDGDIGYYAYLDNVCCHRSWVQKGPKDVTIHALKKISIGAEDVYIQWCETAEWARGKDVYPTVLNNICRDFSRFKKYIAVNKKNLSSISGIEKSKFKKIAEYKISVFLGMKFITKVMVNNG